MCMTRYQLNQLSTRCVHLTRAALGRTWRRKERAVLVPGSITAVCRFREDGRPIAPVQDEQSSLSRLIAADQVRDPVPIELPRGESQRAPLTSIVKVRLTRPRNKVSDDFDTVTEIDPWETAARGKDSNSTLAGLSEGGAGW